MIAFPTLTAVPIATNWIELPTQDATLRSESESGARLRRAKYTGRTKKWNVVYPTMSQTDKDLLTTFEANLGNGADSFTWTNPQNSVVYTVHLESFIEYSITNKPDIWTASFITEESFPNSSNAIQVETVVAANQDLATSDITFVGRILHTGSQVDASDLSMYFQWGSDVGVDFTSVNSTVLNVSDIIQGAVNPVFSLRSNILQSAKNIYYRAVAEASNGAAIGYGEIKSVSSDMLGYV